MSNSEQAKLRLQLLVQWWEEFQSNHVEVLTWLEDAENGLEQLLARYRSLQPPRVSPVDVLQDIKVCLSYTCHVSVMCLSCACHVSVLYLSCACHVSVMCLSCPCHVSIPVMSLSCACHVSVPIVCLICASVPAMCLSCVCHVSVMCLYLSCA